MYLLLKGNKGSARFNQPSLAPADMFIDVVIDLLNFPCTFKLEHA